jgi:hypothetical protein
VGDGYVAVGGEAVGDQRAVARLRVALHAEERSGPLRRQKRDHGGQIDAVQISRV